MDTQEKSYIAIDLKSFYASAECVSRGLDPLTTHLVVADLSRTEKTICLAVSPSLKAYGIPGRARLFEVVQRVREVNAERLNRCGGRFTGKSADANVLREHPDYALDYVVATPRMAHYMEVSTQIYSIYLKYIAPEDIHVYSIDEVFIDVTPYLRSYRLTPHQLAAKMIRHVVAQTGITATAGIGTNMYLCKVAMDIVAKHMPPDADGVRIAELDEAAYRRQLWGYRPITKFWRVGHGIARRLASVGITTMGELARMSLRNEELLYRMFGVNAELLIDHAWGWEPCTMGEVKAYRPESHSFSSGQVLQSAYTWAKARVVVMEMADAVALDLVEKCLVTDQLVLTIGYDRESLAIPAIASRYHGPVVTDHYGRQVPKHAHGTANLKEPSASARRITEAVLSLYDGIVDRSLLIRRINITTNHVTRADCLRAPRQPEQLDLFVDHEAETRRRNEERQALEKEDRMQHARLAIIERYGRNALLRGLNLEDGATARDRNQQIGGHRA